MGRVKPRSRLESLPSGRDFPGRREEEALARPHLPVHPRFPGEPAEGGKWHLRGTPMLMSVCTYFNTVVFLNVFINFPCENSSLMLLPILPNYNFNESMLLY